MPIKLIKTYGKTKSYDSKKKLIRLQASEASIVFDALLAKNRSLCNTSLGDQSIVPTKPNTRKNKNTIKDLPPKTSIFLNDSIDVKINSTFDNLFVGPNYNSVKFTDNISEIKTDGSCNSSSSLLIKTKTKKKVTNEICDTNKNKQLRGKIQNGIQKKKRNTKKKLLNSFIATINNSESNTKIKAKKVKNSKKKIIKQKKDSPVKISKKYCYLEEPVENSLVIDTEILPNKGSYVKRSDFKKSHSNNKETVKQSKSILKNDSLELSNMLLEKNDKNYLSANTSMCKLTFNIKQCPSNNLEVENDFSFDKSYLRVAKAESTPKLNKCSTPIIPKKTINLYNSKIEKISPISLFKNDYNSASLFSESISIADKQRLKNEKPPPINRITKCQLNNEYLSIDNNRAITINDSDSIAESDLKLKMDPVVVLEKLQDKLKLVPIVLLDKFCPMDNFNNTAIIIGTPEEMYQKRKNKKVLIRDIYISENNFETPKIKKIKLPDVSVYNPCSSITTVDLEKFERFSKKHLTILDDTSIEFISEERLQNEVSIPITKTEQKITNKLKIEGPKTSQDNAQMNECYVKLQRISENKSKVSTIINDTAQISENNERILKASENDTLISIIDENNDQEQKRGIKSICLTPGKKWRRSLSIIRQEEHKLLNYFHEISPIHKGRKWKTNIHKVLSNQDYIVEPKRSIFTNNVPIHNRPNYRQSIRVIKLSNKDKRSTVNKKKSGYVQTVTDETVLEDFSKLSLVVEEERDKTAKEIVLKYCNQSEPLLFDECYSERSLTKCRKIGEGVYGEVFMYKNTLDKCVVMKIIPIEGALAVNGEHQKKYEEIISEIIISTELSNLRKNNDFKCDGFVEVLNLCLVQGKYPEHLIDLWELYDEDRGSENDSPIVFTDEQLYIVLELANAGQDLEAYNFTNAEMAYSLFIQIACTLAVAEASLQFEHRDLHWGNVLISPTDEPTSNFSLNGRELEIPTKGIKSTIIDFTLSRMNAENVCIFNDLAMDPDLFTATGDYQFEIYRLMKKRIDDDWQKFEPYTNVLWLDYILDKMISQLRYLRTNSKTHKLHIRKMTHIKKKILNYNSVMEFINSDVFSNVFL